MKTQHSKHRNGAPTSSGRAALPENNAPTHTTRQARRRIIDPGAQAAINRIVLDNLHRLNITPDQRGAIAVALLELSLAKQAGRRLTHRKGRKEDA